jgi:hypothetical protein
MKSSTWACVALVTLLFASRAAAQDTRAPSDAELAEARHSFDVATEAFEQGDYETAVSEFRAAYELSHAADLLFNVYLSEERQGALPEAAQALEQYLSEGTMDAEQHRLLEGRLERLRARIASHAPATTSVEEPQQLLASPITALVATVPADITAPPPPPPETGPPAAAIGVLVAAGALALSFGVFAALSAVEDQRLATTCGRDRGRACDPSVTSTLRAYDIVADVSWIGAAVLGVVDVVLWLVLPGETQSTTTTASLRVRPFASPATGGLVLGGAF